MFVSLMIYQLTRLYSAELQDAMLGQGRGNSHVEHTIPVFTCARAMCMCVCTYTHTYIHSYIVSLIRCPEDQTGY
jgi:hypothetical protein